MNAFQNNAGVNLRPNYNSPVMKGNSDGGSDSENCEMVDGEIVDKSLFARRNCDLKIFDELSHRIWSDPLFVWLHHTWQTDPGTIYREAARLGFERVKEEVQVVKRMNGIRNKGAYLRTRLRNLT